MLSCLVLAATQPRRSLDSFSRPTPTPRPPSPNFFIFHTSENSPVSPSIATLPKTGVSKPCVCHTSKTPPRGPWASSTFGLSNLRTFQRVSDLSPVFSHSWALFCAFLHSRKTQPFYFQAIPHSLHKTPGVGVGRTSCSALAERGHPAS